MKHVHYIFALSFLLLSACSDKDTPIEVPEHIIQQEEMVQLMSDVHLADAYAEINRPESALELYQLKTTYFANVLEKYEHTQAEFDSSLYYYERNLPLLHDTYEQVLEELSIREANLNVSE